MGIKVAYGKRVDITGAIESGVIPKDSLVITSDAKEAELYFYDTDGQIKYVSERKRFETMDEAREWIKTYDCTGHIISVYDGGDWAPYIVTSGGELAKPSEDVYNQIMELIKGIRSVPEGGKKGQVLTKLSDETGDADWQTPTGGTGGDNVQSDWNQNDETQPDYVKNRPFYTGAPVETVLLAETTPVFVGDGSIHRIFTISNVDFSFEVGATYKIYWDGIAYICVACDFNGTVCVGNRSVLGQSKDEEDTGEPFFIFPDNQTLNMFASDMSEETISITVAISRYEPEIVKIDEKYLPIASDNNYGAVKGSEIVKAYYFNVMAPHDELVNAIAEFRKGQAVIMWNGGFVTSAYYDADTDYVYATFATYPFVQYAYQPFTDPDSYIETLRKCESIHSVETGGIYLYNEDNYDSYLKMSMLGTSNDRILDIYAQNIEFRSKQNTESITLTSDDNGVISTTSTSGVSSRFATEEYVDGKIQEDAVIIKSSTPDSTKQFKITVDDNGVISATEVEA